jgi:hypothetical protein
MIAFWIIASLNHSSPSSIGGVFFQPVLGELFFASFRR